MIKREDGIEAIKAVGLSEIGRVALDFLVQEAGFYDEIGCSDDRKETKAVAVRDFAISNIIKPLKDEGQNI